MVWDESHSLVTAARDGSEGYILSRSTESNRRPVSFVFAGEAGEKDGSDIVLDVPLLKESLNFRLLARGLALPVALSILCTVVSRPAAESLEDHELAHKPALE